MPGDVYPYLAHGFNRLWSNVAWLNSCALYLEFIPGIMTQQTFSHLAAG